MLSEYGSSKHIVVGADDCLHCPLVSVQDRCATESNDTDEMLSRIDKFGSKARVRNALESMRADQ